jgi:signal transduction histidine kinase
MPPMGPESGKPRPERDRTDESLRTERSNTDRAIAEKRSGIEETADQLVDRARDQADAVLEAAREKADSLDAAGLASEVSALMTADAVADERALQDEVLQAERAAADERLRRERDEQARTLAALLPLEREKTDRFLLTERARADDALAQRDDFMGMVSHDLRNLLSGIVLNATLLADSAPDSDPGRRAAAGQRIHRYVARMNRLIGDLVDVVSIDAGKLAVDPQRCDAAALVTEAVDAFAHAAAEKGLRLESQVAAGPLPADFDHDRMLQVLANLLANAIKFTPEGGAVVVTGERAGDELRFGVSDTGTGIPEDMLEAVFQRFWQVGRNDPRGLGLGLYISRCIVEAHGGRIWAERRPGGGSSLQVAIPGADRS